MQKIISIILILSAIALFAYFKIPRKSNKSLTLKIKDQNFTLEIADNPYLQAKGLSNRSQLCPQCGMLFLFSAERKQSFWMKETLIPLDMIFIDKSGLITDIYTALPEPGKADFQLKIYASTRPAIYVIELNAGTATKLNLQVGDRINLNL